MAVPSINRRLYYQIVIAVTALWLLVVLGVGWVVKKETDEVFDSSLQELAQRVLALSALQIEREGSQETSRLEPVEHDEYLTYQVFDQQGRLRLRSHDAPAEPFGAPQVPGFHEFEGRRFYVDTNLDQSFVIQVTEPAEHRRHTLVHIGEFLLLPLLLLWPICIVFIYLSVRDARRSFALFSTKIAERRSANLRPLDNEKLPIELHPLSDAVNELMSRLKRALDSERNLAANSAHELRTPIASSIGQLELLRSSNLPAEAMQRVDTALEKLRGLQTTTVKLLQLSRAESGAALNMHAVNLTQILHLFAAEVRRQKNGERYRFIVPEPVIRVRGDMDILGIAIQNLLENAEKYATEGTMIEVELDASGALFVRNDCDAIRSDHLAKLTRRFVRVNREKAGSGIGLAIVETIAAHCDATFRLISPCFENGRGFEAMLALNLCEQPD